MRRTLTGWVVAAAMVVPVAADPLEGGATGTGTVARRTVGAVAAGEADAYTASAASLRRIRHALSLVDDAGEPDAGRGLDVAFEVHVVGSWPAGTPFDGMAPGPGAPAPHGPPTHDELRGLWAPWPGGRSLALSPAARAGWRISW